MDDITQDELQALCHHWQQQILELQVELQQLASRIDNLRNF
jgi:hypothetical protein